ncbi:MAG TPA: hypothetical protein VFF30_12685 [Nitrososphaerales archaeon]|nr:hypothetical protein [Nitrososphaerales archaeon]
MTRLILMRKGSSPEEVEIARADDKSVLEALQKVWRGEIDGIMVMRSAGE